MKTAFIIAISIILPIYLGLILVQLPEEPEEPAPVINRYCLEYYNSDPDITVEDDCNV